MKDAKCILYTWVAILAVLMTSSVQAESVGVRAWPHDGYGRLVFDWPQAVDFQLAQDGPAVTLTFSRNIEPDLSQVYTVLGDYLDSVTLGTDGRSVVLNTKRPVTLNGFQSGNRVVLDLRDSNGGARAQPVAMAGTPPTSPQAQPTETVTAPAEPNPPQQTQAQGTQVPEPQAQEPQEQVVQPQPAAAPAVTPIRSDLPLITVRAGQHPTYNRLVFDWTEATPYTIAKDGGVLTLRFDRAARTNIETLDLSRTPFFAGPRQDLENGALRIVVGVPEAATTRDLVVGTKVVVDVLAPSTARAVPPPAEALPPVEEQVKTADTTPTATPEVLPEILAAPESGVVEQEPAPTPESSGPEAPAEIPSSPGVFAGSPLAAVEGGGPQGSFGRIAEGVISSPQFQVNMEPVPGGLRMTFAWEEDVAAAVFPRAGYYYVAFDKAGRAVFPEPLDDLTRIVPLAEQIAARRGTALRFLVAGGLRPSIARDGANWEVIFREDGGVPSSAIPVIPDPTAETPRIFLPVSDAADRVDFTDPEVGDSVQVIPVGQAAAGVTSMRNFVEFQILPTLQGVAVIPYSESVFLQPRRNGAQVVSDEGLVLSLPLDGEESQELLSDRFPDIEGDSYRFRTWRRVAAPGYQTEFQELMRVISRAPRNSRSVARRDLALFLFSHGFNAEARGVLQRLTDEDPTFALTDDLQRVNGAALVMMNRLDEAEPYLLKPKYDQDGEVALFRGLMYAQKRQWERALPYLTQGTEMINFFPMHLRGQFRLALAEANLEVNNPEIVEPIVDEILDEEMPQKFHDQARYLEAMALAQQAEWSDAITILEELENSEDRWTAARARLADIKFKVELKEMTLAEAVAALEDMRFAWRGGDFELGLVRNLANYNYMNGNFRDALLTMRQTLGNFTGHPEAARVANEMNGVFEELYLEGRADELAPVRALALYQDFRELTPVGEKGDRMIRYLADRLVQVDLLDQAADLLKHQLDFRLTGPKRAEVARQLAVIYLLNRQPREALRVIRATEFDDLPPLIRRQRRHLESRALADMDRFEDAQDLLSADQSQEAEMLRADIAWRAKEWTNAADALTSLLGTKYREPESVLSEQERQWLVQAAVALNMAGDRENLETLRERWTPKLSETLEADSFGALTEVVDPSDITYRDLAPQIAGVQGLEAFMTSYRERLREGGLDAIN